MVLSQYVTAVEIRVNLADFDRCFQVVDRCTARPQSNIVTPVLAKTHFKILTAPHGETKAENIYHCSNVCESCRQFISTNLFKN